jgi:hypothetical protein
MQLFTRSRRTGTKPRKGAALFVSLFFVVAVGALALSSIYLSANATLLGKAYEKEDDLKYTSQAALEIGKAELNFNPAALPNTSYVKLLNKATIQTADGSTVPGLTVNLYAGPTGSTSGQFGRFASVVAEARNQNGTGFVRRLELTQESFAKFAYWTNVENSATGTTIVFANGDALWGPVWSNDTISIGTGGASFHDDVGTAAPVVVNAAAATFANGYEVNQKPIQLPALTTLASLSGLATVSGFNFTPPTTGASTGVLMRIEFVSTDINGTGDSTANNDGFFRVYTAKTGNSAWLRADWPSGSLPAASSITNCGDWHRVHVSPSTDTALKFFPFAAHYHSGSGNTWFDTVVAGGLPGGATAANITKARAEADSVKTSNNTFSGVLQHANVRCYLGGDPHLVSQARTTTLGYTNAQIHKGGEDTTFTPSDQYGAWTLYSNTPPSAVSAVRTWDAKYLFPLYRGYNTNTKGVIYANGTVGISGVVGGDVTLYTPYNLVILDDVRYANDPAKGVCVDILGTISGQNTYVADNSINTPQAINSAGTTYRSMDDTPDLNIQAVIMTIATSFTVENYDSGPTNALTCGGTSDGHGCLYLTGGLIQNNRGPVGLTSGQGYIKRYSYDRCAVVNPPPYFPTTGRFMDNRYYELDPVRVNSTTIGQLYKSLTPGGP